MLAALWQGELVAALGAVVEDVDFRWPIIETNRQGYHRTGRVMAGMRLPRFSKSFLRGWGVGDYS
jgi:hypothetical protein